MDIERQITDKENDKPRTYRITIQDAETLETINAFDTQVAIVSGIVSVEDKHPASIFYVGTPEQVGMLSRITQVEIIKFLQLHAPKPDVEEGKLLPLEEENTNSENGNSTPDDTTKN